MSLVAIESCRSYSFDETQLAMNKVIEDIGGLDFVKPGMTVGIKLNLVAAAKPDKATTTHPQLVAHLVTMLKEKGAKVILGDSPGGLFNDATMCHIYNQCGISKLEEIGAELNRDYSVQDVNFPEAKVLKSFQYTAWLSKCDVVINFCKLKSHGMMGMSCAAKNMFGTIPGITKPQYHYRFPDINQFSDMLLDLDLYSKPVISIVDAVVGMEGNGPTAGKPKAIGAILASQDMHALDYVCARVIGLAREDVPTLQAAYKRGLIPESVDQIKTTNPVAAFVVSDFETLETHSSLLFSDTVGGGKFGKLFEKIGAKVLRAQPKVNKIECVGCKKCKEICPAEAITMVDKLPVIDRDKCIKCFCCQEFCPKGAMKVSKSWLMKIIK